MMSVCESCTESVIGRDGCDPDIAAQMCVEVGSDIADHECDQPDNGEPCDCACSENRS